MLLTADDVIRRTHYANAQRTLDRLLDLGVVPVVNENDTVATDEIRFGDNDRLAALVAHLVHADALVLLTDVDALYDGPPSRAGSRRVAAVAAPQDLDGVDDRRRRAAGVGTGGMVTKVEAAGDRDAAGIPTVLTSAEQAAPALAGEDVGTCVRADRLATRPAGSCWLAHATTPAGRLVLDDRRGRARSSSGGKSLLPAGITGGRGRLRGRRPGRPVRPGRAAWSPAAWSTTTSAELPGLLGRSTRDLARELGPAYEREVVHRDDLVLLRRRPAGRWSPWTRRTCADLPRVASTTARTFEWLSARPGSSSTPVGGRPRSVAVVHADRRGCSVAMAVDGDVRAARRSRLWRSTGLRRPSGAAGMASVSPLVQSWSGPPRRPGSGGPVGDHRPTTRSSARLHAHVGFRVVRRRERIARPRLWRGTLLSSAERRRRLTRPHPATASRRAAPPHTLAPWLTPA